MDGKWPIADYRHFSQERIVKVGATSGLAMANFEEPLTTTTLEAMHFRRGLHYLSVKAAELIVPIPELEDGSPDWRVVQQVEI